MSIIERFVQRLNSLKIASFCSRTSHGCLLTQSVTRLAFLVFRLMSPTSNCLQFQFGCGLLTQCP